MKAERLSAATCPERIVLENRLHRGHPCYDVVDETLWASLQDLPGAWDVSASSGGGPWIRIDVVGPRGASWSLSTSTSSHPDLAGIAREVRAACLRLSRPAPALLVAAQQGGEAAQPHSSRRSHW